MMENTILLGREKADLDTSASLLPKILLKRPVTSVVRRYSPRVCQNFIISLRCRKMASSWLSPNAKFKRGDAVKGCRKSIMKFGAIPKGELEVVKPVWKNDLPLFGPGRNRWFYQCRSKDGGPTVEIQEKYLKEA